MNQYEQKKQARIERMEQRIARLRKFAEGKDLSLFGEDRSGIPMGQPILVGHHSERRHRRHLERLNRLCQQGYDASKMADRLESRLESIKRNNAIQIDNPDAKDMIQAKIDRLTKSVEAMKAINKMVRKIMAVEYVSTTERQNELANMIDASPYKPKKNSSSEWARELISDNRFGGLGFRPFELTNTNAEIRRLKKRLVELERVSEGFEPFAVGFITVELVDGQIQVDFPKKPDEESRSRIKAAGIALKWSSYSKRWVRKHTASTNSRWFLTELKKALEQTTYE